MSNNANGPRWSEGEANPDVVLAASIGALDAFVSEPGTVDFTPGQDIALDLAQYCDTYSFTLINAASAHGLTLPASPKTSRFINSSGQSITLKVGTTDLVLSNSTTTMVYTDGTANGLALQETPSGGSGLPTGGTQGQVLTKNSSNNGDASWQTPSGGGGGGGGSQVVASAYITCDSNGNPTLVTSVNIASVTRLSAGFYKVVFTTAIPAGCMPVLACQYPAYTSSYGSQLVADRNTNNYDNGDISLVNEIVLDTTTTYDAGRLWMQMVNLA